MPLSACLIVRNEERFLDRCLASLHGLVDEICVLDTGSTDRTTEIAKSHGARLGFRSWDDDFSAARNASLDMASGDWILQIDADEELVPPSDGVLRHLLATDAVCHLVELDLRGSNGRSERAWQPRLFRRDSRLRYTHALHETILDNLADAGLPPPRKSPLMLIHHGYLDEVIASRDKIERNLRILRKSRDEGRSDAYDFFKLASALESAHDPRLDKELASAWGSCIQLGQKLSPSRQQEWPWWPRAAAGAATDLWNRGLLHEALDLLEQIAAIFPQDASLKLARAHLELASGRAREGWARLTNLPEGRRMRISCQEALGDADGALREARIEPSLESLLGLLLVRAGNIQEAVVHLERAFPCLGDDAEALSDAVEAFLLIGQTGLARNLLARPARGGRLALIRHGDLRDRLDSCSRVGPPRTTLEAAASIFDGVMAGGTPFPLDTGFHAPAVRNRLADLLEARLAGGDEASVRNFARCAPAWESTLPGISKLVELD